MGLFFLFVNGIELGDLLCEFLYLCVQLCFFLFELFPKRGCLFLMFCVESVCDLLFNLDSHLGELILILLLQLLLD